MKRILVAVFFVLLGSWSICAQNSVALANKEQKERAEAELLWEQMVKAKGGRENLHSVRSMLIAQGDIKPDKGFVSLYVLPNRFWQWSKDRKFYNFMFLTMANLELRKFVAVDEEGVNSLDTKLNESRVSALKGTYLIDTGIILLETKWFKPQPVRVTTQRLFKKRVDVIETRVMSLKAYENTRIDFIIEPETLEVLGHISYSKDSEIGLEYVLYGGYKTLNGIQVPVSVHRSISEFPKKRNRLRFTSLDIQFNVAYDKELFKRIPNIEDGPYGWKPTPKKVTERP